MSKKSWIKWLSRRIAVLAESQRKTRHDTEKRVFAGYTLKKALESDKTYTSRDALVKALRKSLAPNELRDIYIARDIKMMEVSRKIRALTYILKWLQDKPLLSFEPSSSSSGLSWSVGYLLSDELGLGMDMTSNKALNDSLKLWVDGAADDGTRLALLNDYVEKCPKSVRLSDVVKAKVKQERIRAVAQA